VRDHATRRTPRIPAVKLGRLLRFHWEDVEVFLADSHRGAKVVAYDHTGRELRFSKGSSCGKSRSASRGDRGRNSRQEVAYFLDPETGQKACAYRKVILGAKAGLTKFEARLRRIIEQQTSERKKTPIDPRVSFRWYVENRFLVNHRSSWRPATLHSTSAELRLYILPEFGGTPIGDNRAT